MKWIIDYKKYLFILLISITALFAYSLKNLYINFSFESFYPKGDAEYIYYHKYKETFSDDQNYMISIALKSPKNDIFDANFLQNADSVFEEIRKVSGVDSLISGTQFRYIKRNALGVKQIPYLSFENQEEADASRQLFESDSSMLGVFITQDRKHICAHLFIRPAWADDSRRDAICYKIDEILNKSKLSHSLTGVPYIRTQYVEKLGTEVIMFIGIAVILLVIMLWTIFRNKWFVIIPLLTVAVGITWTFGLMAATGEPISLITNLLIPIVFVVGVSDIIHISTKYLTELKEGNAPEKAMEITLNEIGFATFLTCITTAVGFAALAISDFEWSRPFMDFVGIKYIFGADVPPLRVFGLYGCFGVVATYLISIVFIPNILMLIPTKSLISTRSLENSEKWNPFLLRFFNFGMKKSGIIVGATLILMLISGFFANQIPSNMHLLEDLGWRDPVRTSMMFFEENLFGVRPFEMGIEAKGEHKIMDREVLVEIDKIQHYLDSATDFNLFISPVTFIKSANYVAHFNKKAYLTIPDSQAVIDDILAFAENNESSQILRRILTEDGKKARLGARTPDLGSSIHKKIEEELEKYIQKKVDLSLINYQITGHGHLTESNLMYIRDNLLNGLIIDFLVIGLVMGLVFRSFKMVFISMLPNVIPLLATAGVMGLLGITLTTSSAVVFVVIFGIAVDDTIHFMAHYKLERAKLPNDKEEAIRRTMLGTGKAMILTSIILLTGFMTLLSSTFGGTFNIGLFSLITIVFAVLSDLFLAPLLLKYFGE